MKPTQTMIGDYQRGHATCTLRRSVQIPVGMRDGIRELVKLHTPIEHRKNGDATMLLQAICEEADTQGVVLLLHVAPFGESDLGASQLADWYATFGFQTIQPEPHLMARPLDSTPRLLNPVTTAVGHAIEAM